MFSLASLQPKPAETCGRAPLSSSFSGLVNVRRKGASVLLKYDPISRHRAIAELFGWR